MLDQFLWGHSSRVCDIFCFFCWFFRGGGCCARFSSFRVAHFVISSFCLALFRFRLTFFRYFVFSLGVISSLCRAQKPGETTKKRNNETAQTSHHTCEIELSHIGNLKTTDILIWFSRIFPPSDTKSLFMGNYNL